MKKKNMDNIDSDFNDVSNKINASAIIVVILLILLCAGVYYYFTPGNILIRSVVSLNEDFISATNKKNNNVPEYNMILYSSESYTSKSDIKIESLIGNYNMNYSLVKDKNNSNAILSLLEDKNELLKFNIYEENNTLYYKLLNVMDEYFYIENIDVIKNYNIDYSYMINKVTSEIKKSIIKSEVKSEKSNIKINGKNIKGKKITFVYTEKSLSELLVNILEDFKEEKILSDLSLLYGKEEKELKDMFDELIDEIKKDNTNDEILNYSVYTNMLGKIIRYEINNDDILFYMNDNELGFTFYEDNKEYMKFILNIEETDKRYNISSTLHIDGEEILDIDGYTTKDKYDNKFDFDVEVSGYKVNVYGNSKVKVNNTENIEETDVITINMMSQDLVKFTINSTLSKGGTVEKVDITNSKNMFDVTDEDINKISEKLIDKLQILDKFSTTF